MVTFHATALILALFSPVTLRFRKLRNSSPQPAKVGFILLHCVPFVIVGVGFSLQLRMGGVPVSEWIIPAVAVAIAGFLSPTPKTYRLFTATLLFISVGLCIQGSWLRSSGYTSRPDRLASENAAIRHATMQSLKKKFVAEKSLGTDAPSPAPIREVIPNSEISTLEVVTFAKQWHTPLTGLYKVDFQPRDIWYVGMKDTTPELELRATQ